MGSVKKNLYKGNLPEREKHHSRLFVDLAENIHIHHREFRTVFSLNEYFEYVDIITKSTYDVRNFLTQNPDYAEGKYPTTLMIAGGKERQLAFLNNSKKPNKSDYYSNDFAIELQDEYVTDEIHIHYRDFRIGIDRNCFREVAKGFNQALEELNNFEHDNTYKRKTHSDRVIDDFNSHNKKNVETNQMGVKSVPLEKISSNWYNNIEIELQPDSKWISSLINQFKEDGQMVPIVLSTESNGDHLIIDGHHRYYAVKKMKLPEISAVITKMKHSETEKFRQAQVLLKEFDIQTNFEYEFSSFLQSYIGFNLNRYYARSFNNNMRKMKLWYRILRKIKWLFFGKRHIFKNFNESHNC